MKKLCFVVLTCFVLGSFSFAAAAEPNLHSAVNEFKSLVNDKQLTNKLSSDEYVVAIYRGKEGFTILTNKHKVKVDVVAGKIGKGGEQEFHLVFHDPEQRKWKGHGQWSKDQSKDKSETKPAKSKSSSSDQSDQ